MNDLLRSQARDFLALEVGRIARTKRKISDSTAIFHDLSIAGDDAYEFLANVQKRFGTKFERMDFSKYIPDETEAIWFHFGRLLGLHPEKKKRRLTIGHFLDVIQSGDWFEPGEGVESSV